MMKGARVNKTVIGQWLRMTPTKKIDQEQRCGQKYGGCFSISPRQITYDRTCEGVNDSGNYGRGVFEPKAFRRNRALQGHNEVNHTSSVATAGKDVLHVGLEISALGCSIFVAK